ncbi:hypothetical protein LR48_Vigan05g141400 [Vigna angularis]|uniref:Peptidase S8/S53 domain-containing protein n=1 Tax=Phaseolus angularis TaxID=3914 RepID=A0A0L9UMM6_PHAAN|nr:hypothetical protein LR48_Vigan05g141400 [Vigna angularis]
MEGFVLVANPSYGDYIAEPMPLIPRVEDAKAILHYYEEKTKRNKKGNAKEFGALAAVGEGRLASFTGRSLIDTKSGQPGPHQCFRTFPQSISTPHVAGIAALMKQHNPSWTPSMIVYAISTTSSKYDHLGHAIMEEGYEVNTLLPATPFDYGSGFVNPNRVVDPGLCNEDHFFPRESVYGKICSSQRIFMGCLSASEMELSEDYTPVISHGPNPRTTHI